MSHCQFLPARISSIPFFMGDFFQGLQVISEHASLRGDPSDESQPFDIREVDIFHPRYLPSSQMIQLLVDTVEVAEGTIQQNAVAALTEVVIPSSLLCSGVPRGLGPPPMFGTTKTSLF